MSASLHEKAVQRLFVVPLTLREANRVVAQWHRHHKPARGCRFCIGLATADGRVVGASIVSRPVARGNQDGYTAEVVRLVTDGTHNACSMLYSASWRAARELGYRRLITYILASEPGTSVKAAGWRLIGERGGGSWSCLSRPRVDSAPTELKLLWEANPR